MSAARNNDSRMGAAAKRVCGFPRRTSARTVSRNTVVFLLLLLLLLPLNSNLNSLSPVYLGTLQQLILTTKRMAMGDARAGDTDTNATRRREGQTTLAGTTDGAAALRRLGRFGRFYEGGAACRTLAQQAPVPRVNLLIRAKPPSPSKRTQFRALATTCAARPTRTWAARRRERSIAVHARFVCVYPRTRVGFRSARAI